MGRILVLSIPKGKSYFQLLVGFGAFGEVSGDVVCAGAVVCTVFKLYASVVCFLAKTARVKLVTKNKAVKIAVTRVKKLPEPDAPNTVAAPPPPKRHLHLRLYHVALKLMQSSVLLK